MCQQIAALSISIIGHHNACNESLVVNPAFTCKYVGSTQILGMSPNGQL